MFRIGEFARLGQVSVKTLHHYDEIGLLRPAQVDWDTGYRYYTADQLTMLHRILAFKSLGFSLQEITDVLAGDGLTTHIEIILQKKIKEAKQMIGREQVRIEQIESWLTHMKEDIMPKYDVLLKTLEPQLVASIREHMDDSERLGVLFSQLAEYIASHGAKSTGPGVILYHDAESAEEGFDAEAAFPVSAALAETDQIKIRELPRIERAACLVYKGTHEGMGDASRVIATWIEENGYRIAGANRVVFLDCGSTPGGWVVETQ